MDSMAIIAEPWYVLCQLVGHTCTGVMIPKATQFTDDPLISFFNFQTAYRTYAALGFPLFLYSTFKFHERIVKAQFFQYANVTFPIYNILGQLSRTCSQVFQPKLQSLSRGVLMPFSQSFFR